MQNETRPPSALLPANNGAHYASPTAARPPSSATLSTPSSEAHLGPVVIVCPSPSSFPII